MGVLPATGLGSVLQEPVCSVAAVAEVGGGGAAAAVTAQNNLWIWGWWRRLLVLRQERELRANEILRARGDLVGSLPRPALHTGDNTPCPASGGAQAQRGATHLE